MECLLCSKEGEVGGVGGIGDDHNSTDDVHTSGYHMRCRGRDHLEAMRVTVVKPLVSLLFVLTLIVYT